MNPKLVSIVRTAIKGKKLEKFDASIKILNDSLAQGAWVLRGSVKANSGFYQGITKASMPNNFSNGLGYGSKAYKEYDCCHPVEMMLNYGQAFYARTLGGMRKEGKLLTGEAEDKAFATGVKLLREHAGLKLSDEVLQAWRKLCDEKVAAFQFLNDARPKPVLTKILLSPKVTKTLTEMNLDIDLPSVKMPAIVVDRIEKYIDDKGKEQKIVWYRIEWEKGIKHGQSRFADGGGCAACGKHIPSGQFVPVEAIDKKRGCYVSFWLGCDCARNIFGVKDIGLDKTKVVK